MVTGGRCKWTWNGAWGVRDSLLTVLKMEATPEMEATANWTMPALTSRLVSNSSFSF